ncbi:MAG: DUF3300 domain-containing protein [Sulfurimonas sp.]|nr:DUF3300 domain-containing protein [Sulfurimonas sp.]
MASTYNSQLKEAVSYSKAHPEEKGDEAVKKVQDKGWDASVSSLVAFPQVLEMLGKEPQWTEDLGNAFLGQPDGMMDTVQKLRKKAKDAGNLKTTKEQTVTTEDSNSTQVIVVAPATQTVYVPVYNPTYVYGPWMYPAYPPYYYYYPPHYNPIPGLIIGFSIGIMASNCMWGVFGWHSHSVNINVNRYNNINVNKISGNGNKANWNDHKQKPKGSHKSKLNNKSKPNKKDLQRKNAKNAMSKKGLDFNGAKGKLLGAQGKHLRSDLNKGKFNSGLHSSAFSGLDRPSRSHREASRGGFSRSSSSRSFGSHSGGFSRQGGGRLRGRR